MRVAPWANRHARSILFLLAALVLGGVVGTIALPVSLFPRVNFPRIRVNLDAGERPAERMEAEVTRPIEEALRAVPGVRTVHSTTSRGSAEVWLAFDWGEDMISAFLQAESQVNRVLPTLPAGTTFEVRRMDPTVFPVIAYSLTSDSRPLSEVRDIANFQLRPVLSTISGVAKIGVDGGAVEEYQVIVDSGKLRAHNIAISDVSAALSAANVLTAAGRVEDHYKLYLVVTNAQFKTLAQIGDTIVHSGPNGVVSLSAVATIRQTIAPQFTRSTADGRECVLMNVYQQPGGNTVEIAKGIRQTLATQQKQIPSDIRIANWYDQSDLITASARSVLDAVLIGVGLAALVLLLFLRNIRITLVAAIAVPLVLAVTALLLYILDQSFNIMTLGGMAAAVGLIIDDAIVMSEHIVRRLHAPFSPRGPAGSDAEREQRASASRDEPREAAGAERQERGAPETTSRVLNATDEFTKPLAGSSLSTIIIHIPPAFLIGVTGAFFAALSLSMASSLIVSFLVAWLAIPVLAAKLLSSRDVPKHKEDRPHGVHAMYRGMMRPVLRVSWLFSLIIVPLVYLGYLAYGHVQSGFMPTVDEGGFVLDYIGPPGASLTESDRTLRQIEQILQKTPEVQTYSRRTGFSLGGDIQETNMGDFFVRLKPLPRRPIEEVMDDVRTQIEHTIPGMDVELAQLMEDLIGDLTGRPEPIVVNIFSDDQKELEDLAPKLADAISKVPNVVDVNNGIVPAGDALDVEVNRVKASLEGVDADAITRSLTDLLSGSVATQVQRGPKLIDVRVWVPKNIRANTADIEELPIRAPDGHVFPLKRVVDLKTITGQPEITRENLKRVVSITGRISGRDLGSTVRDVQKVIEQPDMLPKGMRYTLGGLYEQQQIAFKGMIRVIIAAGSLVFLLLLFLYESFRVAVAIMLTTLTAIAIVFLGLWLTHTELNISSMMGMVMIVGNVTEVAIFYYSEYVDFMREGTRADRLIAAGIHRMRAIAMTTAAAVLALLPLALGIGQGAGMLQPLAIAITVGLIAQLPLVLVLLPALLSLFRIHTGEGHEMVH